MKTEMETEMKMEMKIEYYNESNYLNKIISFLPFEFYGKH